MILSSRTQWCYECKKRQDEIERLRTALVKLRDCDWVITPGDRMDAVREIAREALGDAGRV